MSPVIDFSKEKGLEPVPEGQYSLQITKAVYGESKKGHPKIDVQWKIQEGEFANRVIFDTLSFHPNATWRAKTHLKNLGLDVSGEVELEDLPEMLLGSSAVVEVGIQEEDTSQINSETQEPYPARNRIAKILPAS